jgi:hypothetical protein
VPTSGNSSAKIAKVAELLIDQQIRSAGAPNTKKAIWISPDRNAASDAINYRQSIQKIYNLGGDQCCLKTARCGRIAKAALVSIPLFAADAFKPHSTQRYFRTSGKETNFGSVQTRTMECPQSGHLTGSTGWGISLVANMHTHLGFDGSHLWLGTRAIEGRLRVGSAA